jgi:hypothetical protein
MASPEIGRQLRALRLVNDGLRRVGVWLLYELLFPAAQEQLAAVGGQAAAFEGRSPLPPLHVFAGTRDRSNRPLNFKGAQRHD